MMAEPCKNVNGSGRFLRQQLNKPIGLLRIILMAKDRWGQICHETQQPCIL